MAAQWSPSPGNASAANTAPRDQLLGAHDEQLGHAVGAARNQGQHRERREARRLAEHDDVARPALERQQRERHQGHEQELLVDVPACGRGSCSRHAAMACSGMDVASMASGATHTPSPRRSRSVSRRRRGRGQGKARQGTRAPTKAEGRERRVRRAGVGQAPRRRGSWTRAPRRRPPAGPRGPSGARRPSGRARAAPRRPSPPSRASRRRPRSSSTPSAGRGRRRHTKPRRSAPSSCARGRARVEGEEAAREFCESFSEAPPLPGWDEEGRQTQSERRYGRAGELEERLLQNLGAGAVRRDEDGRQDRRERQKQVLRAAQQGKQRARLDVVAPS